MPPDLSTVNDDAYTAEGLREHSESSGVAVGARNVFGEQFASQELVVKQALLWLDRIYHTLLRLESLMEAIASQEDYEDGEYSEGEESVSSQHEI